MIQINIAGLQRADVVKALYGNSIPLRMGIFQYLPGPLSTEEAAFWAQCGAADYIHGRYMKLYFEGDEVILDDFYNELAEYYNSDEVKVWRDMGILHHCPLPAEEVIAKLYNRI